MTLPQLPHPLRLRVLRLREQPRAAPANDGRRSRHADKDERTGTASARRPAAGGRQPAAVVSRPKENRMRDKAHLAFVGSQPCLICGRRPAHAHHLKFAQPAAMAMKVSDEFTVPLCAIHHDEVHRSGDERAWWARNGVIEPLKVADRLWTQTRQRMPAVAVDAASVADAPEADPGARPPADETPTPTDQADRPAAG
ncbi:MAG: DUF968 domain-containing protein [Hyphomicrobiaceae bacterium]